LGQVVSFPSGKVIETEESILDQKGRLTPKINCPKCDHDKWFIFDSGMIVCAGCNAHVTNVRAYKEDDGYD
jgi:hypothetical protein